MRLPARRDALQPRAPGCQPGASVEPSGDSCGRRLSEGICQRPVGRAGGLQAAGQMLSETASPPGFGSHFPALLFFLSAPLLGAVILFFLSFSSAALLWFLWQTKLVSPLIRKAGFFWRCLEASMQEPTEQGGERQPPSQTMAKVRRAAGSWSWCALGWVALTALWLERGLSPQWQGQAGAAPWTCPITPSPASLHCPVHLRPPTPPGRQVQTPLSEGDPPLSRDHSPGANSFPLWLQLQGPRSHGPSADCPAGLGRSLCGSAKTLHLSTESCCHCCESSHTRRACELSGWGTELKRLSASPWASVSRL